MLLPSHSCASERAYAFNADFAATYGAILTGGSPMLYSVLIIITRAALSLPCSLSIGYAAVKVKCAALSCVCICSLKVLQGVLWLSLLLNGCATEKTTPESAVYSLPIKLNKFCTDFSSVKSAQTDLMV